MDAEEARKKALQITGDKEKKQYNNIKDIIIRAVDEGKLHCIFYEPLLPSVELKLHNEGYGMSSYFDQRDGTTITITW